MWVLTVRMLFYSQTLQKEGERLRTCMNIPTQQSRKYSLVPQKSQHSWVNNGEVSFSCSFRKYTCFVQSLSVCIEVGQPSLRRLSRVQFCWANRFLASLAMSFENQLACRNPIAQSCPPVTSLWLPSSDAVALWNYRCRDVIRYLPRSTKYAWSKQRACHCESLVGWLNPACWWVPTQLTSVWIEALLE